MVPTKGVQSFKFNNEAFNNINSAIKNYQKKTWLPVESCAKWKERVLQKDEN